MHFYERIAIATDNFVNATKRKWFYASAWAHVRSLRQLSEDSVASESCDGDDKLDPPL